MSIQSTTAPTEVPISATKIWDLTDSRKADSSIAEGVDLRGEIHPDLARYKGWWYCTLKESPLHRMRLIRSADGVKWESVRVFSWGDSGLVGDGKFSVTADGALMITSPVKGVEILDPAVDPLRPDGTRKGYRPLWTGSVTWLSHDGLDWGHVHACPTGFHDRSVVRYYTTWFRGAGYSIASGSGDLYKTLDGKSWLRIQENVWQNWQPSPIPSDLEGAFDPHDIHQSRGNAPRRPNETTLAFDEKDGSAWAIARNHPLYAIIGTASAPDYNDWQWRQVMLDWHGDDKVEPAWKRLGVQMGGPWLRFLSNGTLLAAGRYDASTKDEPKGPLALFTVDRDKGVLRRWGDFSTYGRQYPGIVEYEGQLWIVCGLPSKAAKFEVYLLKTPLP